MEKFLSILRWLLHKLSLTLLGTIIWFFIPLLGFSINATDSTQVKTWLNDSDTYANLIEQAPNFVEIENLDKGEQQSKPETKIDQRQLIESILPAFDEDFLRTNSEQVIDGVYTWLDGNSFEPEFSVSLESKKDEVAKLMSANLSKQIKSLEVCSPEDLAQNQGNFDPLEANCLPEGVNLTDQISHSVNQALEDKESPFTKTLTGEDLNLSAEAKLNAPIAFETLQMAPIFFWSFLLATALIVVLTSKRKLSGVKEVGMTFIISAGILLLASFVGSRLTTTPGNYIFNKQSDAGDKTQAAREVFEPLIKEVVADLTATTLKISAAIFAAGLVIYFAAWYYGKKQQPQDSDNSNKPAKDGEEIPELLKDDEDADFINKVHQEKSEKPKLREKIKKRLIQ